MRAGGDAGLTTHTDTSDKEQAMRAIFKFFGNLLMWVYGVLKVSAVLVFGTIALVILFAAVTAGTKEKDAFIIADGTALSIEIEGFVVEEMQPTSPAAVLGVAGTIDAQSRLHDITRALHNAKDDERISGVVLKLDRMFGASPAALNEIGSAIKAFKEAGKPVIAYGDFFIQPQYFLASFADDIWMNSSGFVNISGYSLYPLYFKEALDEYDVTVNAFRAGTFKSFVEPYTRTNMSEAAKEANRAFLGSLWKNYLSTVSANLSDEAQLSTYVNAPLEGLKAAQGDAAQWAADAGLVTQLQPRSDVRAALAERFGDEAEAETIDYRLYLRNLPSDLKSGRDSVAVLYASGEILDGEQPAGTIGGDTLAARIRRAAEAERIKAIVLRIDSPGGSAFASEIIRQELIAAKAKGKKIVASFGGAAASGGYWIATAADTIIAHPTTITGSIGVFLVAPSFENTLQRFGVNSDGVSTAPLADAFSFSRGISPLGKDMLQLQVEQSYGRFLGLVAEARGMDVDAVDAVAQGRVWTGEQARERGLVDDFGDLETAITRAAELAGLEDYNTIMLREPPTPVELILERIRPYLTVRGAKTPTVFSKEPAGLMGSLATIKAELEDLEDGSIQARCLACASLMHRSYR
ncbi:MAG: signal peptide peptidase SppA [Pseudomonadota bacterium]